MQYYGRLLGTNVPVFIYFIAKICYELLRSNWLAFAKEASGVYMSYAGKFQAKVELSRFSTLPVMLIKKVLDVCGLAVGFKIRLRMLKCLSLGQKALLR